MDSHLDYSSKKLTLRFEVSNQIGLGHFKRMKTLSNLVGDYRFVAQPDSLTTLKGLGEDPAKLIDASSLDWQHRLQSDGFHHIVVDTLYRGNKQASAMEVADLNRSNFSITVIDSMPPDHLDLNPDSYDKPVHCVVTPYLHADHHRSRPFSNLWAVGGQFVILDANFALATNFASARPTTEPGILVTCGGSDPTGLTIKIMRALIATSRMVEVVIGPLFDPVLTDQINLLSKQLANCCVYLSPDTLATLIDRSNIVVGRPGLIRYEAAALRRNVIMLSESEDYRQYLDGFQTAGLAEIYYSSDPGGEKRFSSRLTEIGLLPSSDSIFMPNDSASKLVAVDGAYNVLSKVFASGDH